jgi:hypothetical protein
MLRPARAPCAHWGGAPEEQPTAAAPPAATRRPITPLQPTAAAGLHRDQRPHRAHRGPEDGHLGPPQEDQGVHERQLPGQLVSHPAAGPAAAAGSCCRCVAEPESGGAGLGRQPEQEPGGQHVPRRPSNLPTCLLLPCLASHCACCRIQSLFNALGDEAVGKSIGLGGDGRYFNKQAVQVGGRMGWQGVPGGPGVCSRCFV